MRLSKNPIIQGTATVYIEFFRGTSLLVQLFWVYYVLPFFGISLEAFVAGVDVPFIYGLLFLDTTKVFTTPISTPCHYAAINFQCSKGFCGVANGPYLYELVLNPAAVSIPTKN